MASISIKDVKKAYGHHTIIEKIDLRIADGEFIVLVGPSGCGKSTLLRMIAGLEEITEGDIYIGEEVVTHLPPKARNISMVFQSYALYPHMSVKNNMSYSLRLKKTAKPLIEEKIKRVSAILGLDKLLDRRPKALSGGQRQRVAMGRAIVREPQAFLFDEPLSNLDARLREQMRVEIKRLHRDLKATSIYVTHDQIEAMTLADRIVAMNEGSIQQIGSPMELYESPANIFVASFIGSPGMNFFQANYSEKQGNGFALLEDNNIVDLNRTLPLIEGASFTLGIRPEAVEFSDDSTLSPYVELIEPTGPGYLVHMRLGKVTLKLYSQQRCQYQPHDKVGILFSPEKMHFFNSHGERLVK